MSYYRTAATVQPTYARDARVVLAPFVEPGRPPAHRVGRVVKTRGRSSVQVALGDGLRWYYRPDQLVPLG